MAKIGRIIAKGAPKPLGAYVHAVATEELIFISGIGPRNPKDNKVPGLVLDPFGKKVDYDAVAETIATLENLKTVLKSAASDLEHVLEINVFLLNMDDFQSMNKVFEKYFGDRMPARTTLGVAALPGDISIEMKAIAVRSST